MIKLQGKCKLALAFVAAAAMLGTAWAVDGVSYENGGTIDLTTIADNAVYKPDTNGAITVNISGDLGASGSPDSKNFKIYGAKDNAGGSANFTVNWGKSKLYTSGLVQITAGGVGANIKDSSMTFNSDELSEMNISGNNGSAQKSLLLAAGPEGGSVSGNTTLNINGKLGSNDIVHYFKATAGGLLNGDSTSDSIVVEGDSIVNFKADWKAGEGSQTALLAGPMIQKDGKASGIVKGATIVAVDGGGSVHEIWAAGALLGNEWTPSLTVGSAEVRILKGSVGAVYAGAEVWAKGTATVSGDSSITFSGGSSGKGGVRLYAGHDIEVGGGEGYVNGNSHIKITGGEGITCVCGGGLAWGESAMSIVKGNSNIEIIGDSGLSALSEDAKIFAGGKRGGGNATASIERNGIIKFKDITQAYKGTINGQGETIENENTSYTDSVSGDSVLVFDNVKADFSGATIVEMDRIELANGTELKLANLGGAKTLKLTGDWAGKGTFTALTVADQAADLVIDDDEANGIIDHEAFFDGVGFTLVVNCSKVEKEKPIKPRLPEGAPQDIIAAAPKVIYIDVTSDDVKKEAIDAVVLSAGGALQTEDIVVNEDTALMEAAGDTITKAAKDALAKNSEGATVVKVRPLPVFGVESGDIKEAGAVVAVGFEMKGSEFLAAKPEDVRLLKVQGSAAGKFFEYAASESAFGDGRFTVQDENDKIFTGALEADTKYKLVFFIKDNGEFDLRDAEREILDPAALVKTEARPSGGSSSGCSAGVGVLALLALLPLAAAKRRK